VVVTATRLPFAQSPRSGFNRSMRTWAALAICTWVALAAAVAAADTFYKYRDKASGRDVFVNRLDQVPRKYRAQARIVLEAAPDPNAAAAPSESAPAEAEAPTVVETPAAHPAKPQLPNADEVRKALAGKDPLRALPVLAVAVADASLTNKGHPPLYANERAALGELIVALVIAMVIASVVALIAWLVVFVTALRDGRLLWAILMFFLPVLAYVYAFVLGGKGRTVWKVTCALGLVSLIGAWRFYAWLGAVLQARGGHL
jgi:hypothetical protein